MTLLKRLAWFITKEGLADKRWFKTREEVKEHFLKEYAHVLKAKNATAFGHNERRARYVGGSVLAGTLGSDLEIEHVIEKLRICEEDFRENGLKAVLQHDGKKFLISLKTRKGYEKKRRFGRMIWLPLANTLDGMWMWTWNPWLYR